VPHNFSLEKIFYVFYILQYIKNENKLQFFAKCYIIEIEKTKHFLGLPMINAYHLIFNPTAGKNKKSKTIALVKQMFAERGLVTHTHFTQSSGDATRIVKELTSIGTYRYTTTANEVAGSFSSRLNTIFKECVVSLDYAQNIIVVRTLPGLASAAGSAIDAMSLNSIVGSLAGDDTVMVVMRDSNAAAAFCGEIKNLIN
jgi:arginine repressor